LVCRRRIERNEFGDTDGEIVNSPHCLLRGSVDDGIVGHAELSVLGEQDELAECLEGKIIGAERTFTLKRDETIGRDVSRRE
jgi:hypothetical protein